jgi:hypothetical protein
MARGACTFRQRDLTRAVKGLKAAGFDVRRVEIEERKIVLVTSKPETPDTPVDELDRELAEWEEDHAG